MRSLSLFRSTPRLLAALLAAPLLLALLAGCGSSSSTSTGGSGTTHLTVGLTYVPDIQFAPFYVAEKLGYYSAAGLDVTLRHHTDASEGEFAAIAAGREDAIFAGGDEMLGARAHNQPLVYIANIYRKYPVALVVPADSPIHSAADLRGHTIGIPGQYGESYYGLLALLRAGNLSLSDVHVQSIGYTQVPALLTHKVDAVIGYVNNEPIQLAKAGMQTRTLDVTSVQPLVSNGLITTQTMLSKHPDEARAFVAATLRGVEYVVAHPQDAVNISKQYVPGLDDPTKAASALAVLQATIPLWQLNGAQPGYTPPSDWQSMASFLQSVGQLPSSVDVAGGLSNAYLPK